MQVTVLGGGDEIGASCLHVELNGTRLLFDAGMRMHSDEAMPALSMIEELGGVDAVFITHAHADHIGALPVAHLLCPNAPVYATPPTIDLMRIMMQDSYRILESRSQTEHTLMPYTEAQMTSLLEAVRPLPPRRAVQVKDVEVTSYRAGHILGAVMFGIAGGGERLLISGDISVRAGRTIPGVKVPYDFQPDVVVLESTYGNRLHVDRHLEEKRLAENVAEVVAGGGFALIPAFALGRSQEVLLVLQDYMEKGLIPRFPIYVDGLVTPICRIYRGYPQYLKGPLAYRIRKHGDAFLQEDRVIAVENRKQREQVLQGPPGCIVASSGMLIGGASVWYAERLVQEEKHAIFITGYQDEESPGRQLLSLADGEHNTLELNGTTYDVHCRVDKYGLSAHADAMEMVRFVEGLKPAHTLLVHGDEEARLQLSQRIEQRYEPILVENGSSYSFHPRSSGKGVIGKQYRTHSDHIDRDEWIGAVVLLRDDDDKLRVGLCVGVHVKTRTLVCQPLEKQSVTRIALSQVVETLGQWNQSVVELQDMLVPVLKFNRPLLAALPWDTLVAGTQYTLQEACERLGAKDIRDMLVVALALQSLPRDHVYDIRGETLYVLDENQISQLTDLRLPVPGSRLDPTSAMEKVRQAFEGHPRFVRCGVTGADKGDGDSIMIHFDFPDAVPDTEKSELHARMLAETGWDIEFSNSVRQDQLVQVARTLLEGTAFTNPSIHLDQRRVTLDIDEPPHWEAIKKQFLQTTGFHLSLKNREGNSHQEQSTSSAYIAGAKPEREPMEINAAIHEAKQWAASQGVHLYKVGVRKQPDGTQMELHFISPQVAERYGNAMKELADRVGMSVTYARHPKQNEILTIVNELLPPSWGVTKNPSIHADQGEVRVKLPEGIQVSPSEQNGIQQEVTEKTGYTLVVD